MKTSVKQVSLLSTKSLILSILIHLSVFNIFVFYFPVHPESFKPSFSFLGSILKMEDVQNPQKQQSFANIKSKTIDYKVHSQKQGAFSNIDVNKPKDTAAYKKRSKQHPKSTFEISEPKEVTTPDSKETKDLGIDLNLTPYKPLRINPNDQN